MPHPTDAPLLDLHTRVPQAKPFATLEDVRAYDLGMRKSALMAYLKPAKRILAHCTPHTRHLVEVGVNTGVLSLYLGARLPEAALSGVEENATLLEVAEDNLSLAVWAATPGDIEFELAKLHKLPFADASADLIYSFSSLHLWKKPVETLQEIARVAQPECRVLIFDMNRQAEEGHITFVLQFVKEGAREFMDSLRASYCPEEVRELLKQAGLAHWHVYEDELGLLIASHPQDDLSPAA
ncbi:class I SAM-dependent methyltransferase [Roseateles sp. BYS180W]|uniref:Class I SAM-dependent methyltransferase n=1 Tax=Roseateles rivi TaxID=3299028 RepID=A0ABW7FU02_9BURK